MDKQELIKIAKDTYNSLNDFDDSIKKNILYYNNVIDISKVNKVNDTNIYVQNADCIDITRNLSNVCVLNFASAHKPGGGWLTGANAQEESITRRSTLYASIKDSTFYDINKNNNSEIYSEAMIYSPKVTIFKTSMGIKLTNTWDISVITAPAINLRNVHKTNAKEIKNIMINRIRNLLKIAIINGNRNIVLGAWGCGVFGHNPKDIAEYFRIVLNDEGLKDYFDNIVFAIYHNIDNFKSFRNVFIKK